MPLKDNDFRGFWNEILLVAALMAIIAFSLSAAPVGKDGFIAVKIGRSGAPLK